MSAERTSEIPPSNPVQLASAPAFSLGPVAVDPARRSLERAGQVRVIEPRTMQVLVALAQASGTVVSREALVQRCWEGRIVGDDAIYRVISQLRALAADLGADAFRIETIAKVGYRLACDGAQQAPAASPAEPPPIASTGAPAWPIRAATVAPAWTRRAAVGALATGAAGLLIAGSSGADAVDPFQDLIAQSENAARLDTPESVAKGVGLLQQAVALQPSNPLGWGRLGLALGSFAEYSPPDQMAEIVSRVQDAARRALALDAAQPDAKAALALLAPHFGDWLAAEQRLQQVLARHPRHLPTLDARDFLFSAVGCMREASSNRLSYARVDPLHARLQYRLVYAQWNLGAIGEADRTADRALQLWPMHSGVWFARLWTLAFTGRPERALAQLEDTAARPALPAPFVGMLRASLQALSSRTQRDVNQATSAMIAALGNSPSVAVHAVMTLAALGDLDRAFAVAEAYLLERGPLIASVRWREGQVAIPDQRRRKTHMLFVPATAPLRRDPRFARLMEDVGLAAYWGAAGVTPDHLNQA